MAKHQIDFRKNRLSGHQINKHKNFNRLMSDYKRKRGINNKRNVLVGLTVFFLLLTVLLFSLEKFDFKKPKKERYRIERKEMHPELNKKELYPSQDSSQIGKDAESRLPKDIPNLKKMI